MYVFFAIIIFYLCFGFLGIIGYDSNRDAKADVKQKGYFRNLNIITCILAFYLIAIASI